VGSNNNKKKILFIDDEVDLCKLVKVNLESLGEYEVTTVSSGEEGIKKAKELDFDLVITDFKMPGMDGEAVLDALKAMKPHLPVVFFSIYHDDISTIDTSVRNRVNGIVSKPIDHKHLYEVIKDILG